MNYQALLFCTDEKTARLIAQVLNELEFAVETGSEPFAAVKKLMAQRFDAVVVDCDDEQNAALLFKSVRNSQSNQAALMVAIVGGQAGVAKAFRLGANLVLTKPINVEQSKGTLRVARGLLKKGEPPKPAPGNSPPASNAGQPRPAVAETPKPGRPAPAEWPARRLVPDVAASTLELEMEPGPQLDPGDAAFLESMPQPVSPFRMSAAQEASSPGAAAAAAPAKESAPSSAMTFEQRPAATVFAPTSTPAKSSQTQPAPAATHVSATSSSSVASENAGPARVAGSNKLAIAAAVAIAVAAAGYLSWTKLHSTVEAPAIPTTASSSSGPAATGKIDANLPSAPPAAHSTTLLSPASKSNATDFHSAAAQTGKNPSPSKVPSTTPSPAAKTVAVVSQDESFMVKSEAAKPVPAPVIVDSVSVPEPPVVDVDSHRGDAAISGIVGSMTTSVPTPSGQAFKVSQGVSQGLLIKRVAPMYPQQAKLSRIQGAVQLQAVIGKDGSITSVSALSGDPILARAALDAVRQWKYKPYDLDGQAIEIQTTITVNFKLP